MNGKSRFASRGLPWTVPGTRFSATLLLVTGLFLLSALAPPSSHAQEVRGAVSGLDGRTPVAGALVLLLDVEDRQVDGVLADPDGITVEPDRRCHTISEGDASTIAQFWEEAQKALELTRFAEESGEIMFLARTFTRTLGPAELEVRTEEILHQKGAGVMPFTSAPPDSLALLGYVQGDQEGGWKYFGPDAAALMSTVFLNTHCLRFHEDGNWADSVGIRIEPAGDREPSEIRGVLWVDGGSFKLRRLEFEFVNTSVPVEEEAEYMGGVVEFEELRTGAWIVSEWAIRMPIISGTPRRSEMQYRLDGYLEVGGDVVEVWDLNGQPLRTGVSSQPGR